MNNKLFVGNLSFDLTENDLQDAFAAHGTVLEANLMLDRVSGRPREDRPAGGGGGGRREFSGRGGRNRY